MQKSRSIILFALAALKISGLSAGTLGPVKEYSGNGEDQEPCLEPLTEPSKEACSPQGQYHRCRERIRQLQSYARRSRDGGTTEQSSGHNLYKEGTRLSSSGDKQGAGAKGKEAADKFAVAANHFLECANYASRAAWMSERVLGFVSPKQEEIKNYPISTPMDDIGNEENPNKCFQQPYENLRRLNASLKADCGTLNSSAKFQAARGQELQAHGIPQTAPGTSTPASTPASSTDPAPSRPATKSAGPVQTEPEDTAPQVAAVAPPGSKPSGPQDADPSLTSGLEGAPKAQPIDDPILGDNGAGYGRKSPAGTPRAPTSSTSGSGSGAMMPALLGAVGGGVLGYVAGRANRTTETITNTKTTTVTGTNTNTNTASSSDGMAAIDCTKLGFATNADGTCNASVAAPTTTATIAGNVVAAPVNQVVNGSGAAAVASTTSTTTPGVFVQNSALAGSRNSNLEIESPDCSNPANAERQSCQAERRALGTAQRAIFCSRNPSNPQCAGL